MAASTPLPHNQGLIAESGRSSFQFPVAEQELRIKNTLLMAAAYRSGDDHNSGSTETPSPTSFRLEGNNPANAAGGSSIGGYNAGGIMMLPPTPAPVEHRSSYISAGAGALEPNDDEHNLRTTCDGCTISKIRCDGGHPCKRCLRRRVDCVYREKKRCGPKRRRSQGGDSEDDSNAMGTSEDGSHSVSHKVLTLRERQFLAKFYNSVNKFIPMTCHTVLRDAMNPLPLDVIDGVTASESEKNVYHARKAVLLGSVALGAVFCGDSSSAGAYMAQAQIHLKDCFDALLPEVVSCYLVMVIYHLHFLDKSKVFRYIGFAQQALRELKPSQQVSDGYVRDSVRMLSTFLHVACDSDIRVEEIELSGEGSSEPGSNTLPRILAIFSYVLLMLFRRLNPIEAAKAPTHNKPLPSLASLGALVDEADLLLSMVEDPGSFAIIVMKTLRGYFLLLKGKDQEVQESVALPVAKALEADHGVLHFPLCWHLCQCVRDFLHRRGLHAAAAGMARVVEPLRQTLSYANTYCRVALDVSDVYAGKGTAALLGGLSSRASRVQSKGFPPSVTMGGWEAAAPVPDEEHHSKSADDSNSSVSPDPLRSTSNSFPSSLAEATSSALESNPTGFTTAGDPDSRGRKQGGGGASSPGRPTRGSAVRAWAIMPAHGQQQQQQQQQPKGGGSNSGDGSGGTSSSSHSETGQSSRAQSMSAGGTSDETSGTNNVNSSSSSSSRSHYLEYSTLFGTSSTGGSDESGGGCGLVMSTPVTAPSLSHTGVDDVGGLLRGLHNMFDLASRQSAFAPGRGRRGDRFAPNNYALAAVSSGVGSAGSGPGPRGGGGGGRAGPGGVAGTHDGLESAGSSPLGGGLSSEHSATSPAANANVDSDSGDSGVMTGILDLP